MYVRISHLSLSLFPSKTLSFFLLLAVAATLVTSDATGDADGDASADPHHARYYGRYGRLPARFYYYQRGGYARGRTHGHARGHKLQRHHFRTQEEYEEYCKSGPCGLGG